jgi:hypothetical protein
MTDTHHYLVSLCGDLLYRTLSKSDENCGNADKTSFTPQMKYVFSARIYDIPARSPVDVTYRTANCTQIGQEMR